MAFTVLYCSATNCCVTLLDFTALYVYLHLALSYLDGSTPWLMRTPLIKLRPPHTGQYLGPINKTESSIGLFLFYVSAGAAPIKLAKTRLTSKSASLHYGYIFIYSDIGVYYLFTFLKYLGYYLFSPQVLWGPLEDSDCQNCPQLIKLPEVVYWFATRHTKTLIKVSYDIFIESII